MATPTKTTSTAFLAHQVAQDPTTIKGAWISVAGMFEIAINLYHAIIEAAANTNPGTFYIHASSASSDALADNDFSIIDVRATKVVTGIAAALGTTEAAGETSINVDDSANVAAGDWCYVQDTTTETDSEWRQVSSIVNGTPDVIHLVDGLTVGKDSADKIWNGAEVWPLVFNVVSYQRLRVIYVHQGATAAKTAIKATYGALTAIA